MTPVPPIWRSMFTFHVCIRPGRKFGSVKDGASDAAPEALSALASLMLLVAVPEACPEIGVVSGGLHASPTKYPVLVWFTMTAYALRTTVLPSLPRFQMRPRRGWKSLPFLVTCVKPFVPYWTRE